MPNDFKMFKLVRANHVAQAIFFKIILKPFRKIACGFSSPTNQYSQDVNATRKPIEVFGLVDFLAFKGEESGRMAQHAHGLFFFQIFQTL